MLSSFQQGFFSPPKNENFEPWNEESAADLKIDGDKAWNDHRYPLLHGQLKLDARFRYVFFSFSLPPTAHHINLGYDAALFLYCARNNPRMDIGQIIMNHIFRGGHSSKAPLTFSCLITHFCEEVRIDMYGGVWIMFPPMTNMGKGVYNNLAKHRGVMMLEEQSNEENMEDNPDDPDYEEKDLGGDPDAEQAGQGRLFDFIAETILLFFECGVDLCLAFRIVLFVLAYIWLLSRF
ncbi:hypothetical protein Ddye_014033 [Dipteronia dyeriana]|uniref:Putative plant transposon protein domain-containing protein n=1 Tax=Dipteronia dyeriana TaxID=168575 RepID=A0AAE0CK71_9ROSI|nr:hypothetical protein Ddye_014033 [Dipteronia dyeriana]